MTRLAGGLLPLVLVGCLFGGGDLGAPVEDAEALAFESRARSFYENLEAVPLDALLTYENAALRDYFANDPAFADYYSSLANQVRSREFRDGRVKDVEILEFRLDGSDTARVDLRIVGEHERALRFWDIDVQRTDTWRRIEGRWLISPDKL